MNRKSIGTALLLLAILAALAFIWGNSLDSAVESAVKSGRVRELLQPLLERLVGQGGVTDHLVRKLAHFTEFAVLGALLLLLTAAAFRVRLQSVVNCLFFLLLAALTDETIQIFTGRGPQVQDVWLDFAGGAAGLLVMLALVQLLRCLFRPRRRPAADARYAKNIPRRRGIFFSVIAGITGSFSVPRTPARTSAPWRPRPAAPGESGCRAAPGRGTRRPAPASY